MTAFQRDLLLHMTGLDRAEEPTRSHCAAEQGGPMAEALEELKAAGLVRGPFANESIYPGLAFYYVTTAGLVEARRCKDARNGIAGPGGRGECPRPGPLPPPPEAGGADDGAGDGPLAGGVGDSHL